jgi:hypothetical protein
METSSGDDETRPKTATLKRPYILDESLKDKVDMTLTRKAFMAAVKLCSDAAVQRGLPNMRLKATKGKNKAAMGFQQKSRPIKANVAAIPQAHSGLNREQNVKK